MNIIKRKQHYSFHFISFIGAVLFLTSTAAAHHPLLGKFNADNETLLSGTVTYVDWRNPHAHIFMNVDNNGTTQNWAVELESPIILRRNGWQNNTLEPGDSIIVEGIKARNDSRQVWGNKIIMADTGRSVYSVSDISNTLPLTTRPTPHWPDGQPALGATTGSAGGFWSFPSEKALIEDGVNITMNDDGLLNSLVDASKVAPMQDWALALYKRRQSRNLMDDPMYLNCIPPGGPRQYQSELGLQLIEDRKNERIFALIASGNRNYRIIHLDNRNQTGQVNGDDDNPLFFGRSSASWVEETLVVNTTGFNEGFWFSNGGLPHTEQLEMVERFTRPNFDTLEYEVTINDPGAYTRPWTASWTLQWVGGEELPIHFCQNNRQ